MTVSTAASLHEVAQELLDAAERIIATTSGGPILFACLSPGLPALDRGCDQIAVWATALGDEQMSPLTPIPQVGQRRRIGWLNLAGLSVLVARCLTVQKIPVPDATLTLDAEKVMEDGWALWNGVSSAIRSDGIFVGEDPLFGGTCTDIKFVSMTPLTPEGGMGGWVLSLSVEIAGYR